MADFERCDGTVMMDLKTDLEGIRQALVNSYYATNALDCRIKNGTWSGKSYLTMCAIMDLFASVSWRFHWENWR